MARAPVAVSTPGRPVAFCGHGRPDARAGLALFQVPRRTILGCGCECSPAAVDTGGGCLAKGKAAGEALGTGCNPDADPGTGRRARSQLVACLVGSVV